MLIRIYDRVNMTLLLKIYSLHNIVARILIYYIKHFTLKPIMKKLKIIYGSFNYIFSKIQYIICNFVNHFIYQNQT